MNDTTILRRLLGIPVAISEHEKEAYGVLDLTMARVAANKLGLLARRCRRKKIEGG